MDWFSSLIQCGTDLHNTKNSRDCDEYLLDREIFPGTNSTPRTEDCVELGNRGGHIHAFHTGKEPIRVVAQGIWIDLGVVEDFPASQ